jgi:uroporphyrinogen decarboxylase
MNSKDRTQAALARLPHDRVPVFMWFHPSTARRLAGLFEIPASRVGEAMGNDIRQAWVNNNYAMEGVTHEHEGDSHVDAWGIEWRKEGEFNQIVGFPLEKATPQELLDYRFPLNHREDLLNQMAPLIPYSGESYIGVDVSPCVFEMYWRLRGMEMAMLDMAERPGLADTLLGRCADFAVDLSEAAFDRFPVDWLWTGDDVAGQKNLMMSRQTWRNLIQPHLQRVVDVGKAKGLPVAYHCCGALRPIIGDLVEMGIGILNPVQCNCPGMDPLDLKREFGSDLTFMGGVDTQWLLPHGTVDDVRRETARLLEGMTADGGGYILAASHTIPPETPDDNIFAMYHEAGIRREEIFDRAAGIRRELESRNTAAEEDDHAGAS